ncbi:MAG: DEAD/DEAH box helicase family protein [Anaerolineales bacterium]|nr:DEAD/DEAH box helicase family protein [Anaerolineales bacterium]
MRHQTGSHKGYWQAEGLVQLSWSRFQAAVEADNIEHQRSIFYTLANYHGRTLHVLNNGLHKQDEPLVQAALHNLLRLHTVMMQIHRTTPHHIPLPVVLSIHSRDDFVRDLVMRTLAETPPALASVQVHERANYLDLMGNIPEDQVVHHLQALAQARHIETTQNGYVRTNHPYGELDKNVASLRALIGRTFFERFANSGFDSLRAIGEQLTSFKQTFPQLTGLADPHTVELFMNIVHMLLDTSIKESTVWRSNDLLHSHYPRPYQRAAFHAFRRSNYQGQIIEAPTGSGKTLIGMMCIQDWLRELEVGQSILVLVPTSNYQQQWIDELCYNPIGLRLSPEIIFSGTPAELTRYQRLTGSYPAILLITYTAVSHLGSPKGKGGFDTQSIEQFLQQADVQHIILDEVHKVVEDKQSIVTDVTRLLASWQQDTSLHSLIGFSGTAEAYRSRFEELGLTLSYRVPIEDLVAAGFVAPFAEMGVPFALSAREQRIRELLEAYKDIMQRYFKLLGPAQLRRWFAQIPLAERKTVGHHILSMYRARPDWQIATEKRFQEWENGPTDSIKITEAKLLTILQVVHDWSDHDLVNQAGADQHKFNELVAEIAAIKAEMAALVYLPKTVTRLNAAGFTTSLDAKQLLALPQSTIAFSNRPEAAKDLLATTIVGLYDGLNDWYLRTGEGRVKTIKAIIEAERKTRHISGIIIFDKGRHIPWRHGSSNPGYQGVAGLFSELLAEPHLPAMAVLSNEMYLTWDAADPVTLRIAEFILEEVIEKEIGPAMFNLIVSGLDLSEASRTELHFQFENLLRGFQPNLKQMHAARPGLFNKIVLRPLRRNVKKMKLGLNGERLLARLDRRNVHLKLIMRTMFDYGLLAVHFREAHVAEVEQVSGARQKLFVVTMPGAPRRKQLMYDLTARIVDAPSLPIYIVVVSDWARTGWNVIRPNLLIDATATRSVTAWQQLRGRAIRAWRSWNNDCYRLLSILVGHPVFYDEDAEIAADGPLDEALGKILREVATPQLHQQLLVEGVAALSRDERQQLASALMQTYNKVTHIYELVKASGSTHQVIFNRTQRIWQRRENIAAKHNSEVSVNPFNGQMITGDAHAPLIYAHDPRTDIPADLQEHLQRTIKHSDQVITTGWLFGNAE